MFKKFVLSVAIMVALISSTAFAGGMQLIPQDAAFVLHVNIAKVTSLPEVKAALEKNLAKSPAQKKAFDEFVAKTGLNPLQDIKELVMFFAGKVVKNEKSPLVAVIINGNFNQAKLLKAVQTDPKAKKDVKIGKIGKYDAVLPLIGKEGVGAFLDANTIVIGAMPGVEKVIGVKDGKIKGVAANKRLSSILAKVDTSATLCGAGVIPQEFKDKVAKNPQAVALASLQYFFFSFNSGTNIQFNFNGEVDKKENVETVMTSLNGFLTMLKMFAGQAPEAGEILNMVKIGSKAKTVKISLSVPKAKLEEIKKKIEARMKKMQEKKAAPAKK